LSFFYNFNYWEVSVSSSVMAEFAEHAPFKVTFLHENLQLRKRPPTTTSGNMAASLKSNTHWKNPIHHCSIQTSPAVHQEYGQSIFGN